MGRPQLSADRRRTKQLGVRLSAAEWRVILERTAQVAENELEQRVRELSSSELREYQQRERARYPDRGGPSR